MGQSKICLPESYRETCVSQSPKYIWHSPSEDFILLKNTRHTTKSLNIPWTIEVGVLFHQYHLDFTDYTLNHMPVPKRQ